MSESAAPAPPTSVSPARQCAVAATVFLASLVACAAVYLALNAHGPWFAAPSALRWTARNLTANRGTAQLATDSLMVTAPDAAHSVVIALGTSFLARDYPVIAWDASGIPPNVGAALLWYSDISSSRVFRRALTVEAGRIMPVDVADDRAWLGRIRGLALVLQGSFSQPIAVRGAMAKPMSALELLQDASRAWLKFEPWSGSSINGLVPGLAGESLPLPAALAVVAALAGLAYAGLWRWKLRSRGAAIGSGLAVIFMAAWVLLDARWQWNLLRQADATVALYGGKSWQERHLAAEDGALFAFISEVRAKLPPPPARVFVAADLAYFRHRAAYHLYPYDVYYDPGSTALPPPSAFRKDDYLVVYRRQGVQYDTAQQRLSWDGEAPLNAELLLNASGAALLRIR
ncbi:MAG TPA: hypothetical protein VMN79_06845 [Casimicrobiaceae bacterium]|nr:hypothetical protein [Casimicrobiaceae bacterium]